MNKPHLQHLYWRAGFGILPNPANSLSKLNRTTIVDKLFETSKTTTPLTIDISEITSVDPKTLLTNKPLKLKLIKKSRALLKTYNFEWLKRLNTPKELLRERMTLFWSNHFVCTDKNITHVQHYNNTLRTHALGNFRDFVKKISKEAAMINYLNLKQNRKGKPNENFARELMELFTLGVDQYSEQDIKEAARAFTGYNHNFIGDFKFRIRRHDTGEKTFFNKTGHFSGDDIIDIILNQKQCAKFICEKIYKYFVNHTINKAHIDAMLDVFFPVYDIEILMRFIFNSDWFYKPENIGTKIKSPIDWFIGIQNTIPITFKAEKELLKIQKLLGQILLYPPNVAGWPGHQNWIDSNTIVLRLKLPTVLLNKLIIPTTQNNLRSIGKKSLFNTTPNWEFFHKQFSGCSLEALEQNLIQCSITQNTKSFLRTQQTLKKEDYLIQLLSLPEFQMC